MDLFNQTVTIMIVGMSLVFFFIFIVIQCMNLIDFMVHRYEAKHPALPSDESTNDAVPHSHVAAAIAVATELITEKN
jgi:Na+-transporting methylmalonyl-CoA/oxaloacetate decarboxylase gamma subunit